MPSQLKMLLILILLLSCTSSSYPISDHYNGQTFFNPWPGGSSDKNFLDLLKWQWADGKEQWPEWIPETELPQLPTKVEHGDVHLTMVNHASYLMQFSDFNIITDPVFSDRVSPISWLGPARRRPPGLTVAKLPKIDYVIISHNHYDHMDLPSIRALADASNPLFIVPLGNKRILESVDVTRVVELDWWQTYAIRPGHSIHLVPVQHWSTRGLLDRNQALWGGYVVDADQLKVYFAGDTGYGPHFKETFKRFGPMNVSLLPIGAYEPRWFMKDQHMNPEEAVQAHQDLGSKQSLGMHFGTFQLTDEGIDRPIEALRASLDKAGIDLSHFFAAKNGQTTWFSSKAVKI